MCNQGASPTASSLLHHAFPDNDSTFSRNTLDIICRYSYKVESLGWIFQSIFTMTSSIQVYMPSSDWFCLWVSFQEVALHKSAKFRVQVVAKCFKVHLSIFSSSFVFICFILFQSRKLSVSSAISKRPSNKSRFCQVFFYFVYLGLS